MPAQNTHTHIISLSLPLSLAADLEGVPELVVEIVITDSLWVALGEKGLLWHT